MTWFLYSGGKSLVFSMSMQVDLNFLWVVQVDLILVWDKIDLVNVWVVENDFISVWWIGIDLFFVQQSKMTMFCIVRIEIHWVFVSGHRNRLDIRVWIEIDMISVMGSTSADFYVRDRN